MKIRSLFLLAALLLPFGTARAQWVTKTYTLANGWNGVWLSGDASYTTVADLFASYPAVTEVWRWNPNPDQIQFTSTPSDPTVRSDEWTVWKRNDATEQLLTRMVGNSSYLVRCSSATSVSIKELAVPPQAVWLVSGANFLGFPSAGSGTGAPTMSTYFASYPSASTTVLSSPSKIYKYIGGELNSTNPLQISPGTERMDPDKAYWFNVPTVSSFTAPLEYEVSSSAGLAFGRTLSTSTVGVTNRSTASLTLTVSLEASEAAPANQLTVTGGVPLTRRVFNSATNGYDETPVTSFTVTIPASGRANLDFGINRGLMAGSSSSYYASILRIKDSAGLSDVRLPVSAQPATTAGLWACQAKVTNVTSTLPSTGTTTSQPFPLVFLVHVDSSGVARLLSQAFVGRMVTDGNPLGICISEGRVLGYANSDVKPHRYLAAQMPMVPFIAGDGPVATGNTVTWGISVPFDDPTNPFVHAYHPDHDNLSSTYTTHLGNGVESYTVNRTCVFEFTTSPPDGSTVTGWGTTVLGGNYSETLNGLNSKPLHVSGTFAMRRISEISDIDLTPP